MDAESEMRALRSAIKGLHATPESEKDAYLKSQPPEVVRYFERMLAALGIQNGQPKSPVCVEIGEITTSYKFGKLFVGETPVADVAINRHFEIKAESALRESGIRITKISSPIKVPF